MLTQVIIRTLPLSHSLASDFRVLYPASLISYQCKISTSTDKGSQTPDPKVLAQHHHSDRAPSLVTSASAHSNYCFGAEAAAPRLTGSSVADQGDLSLLGERRSALTHSRV
ncbi:hypothetical protein MRS44_003293 [Fusarium solani]|uniref:uncharacterized protein n=1 Tax=Fusarium solani TaxID=169388 RepID=UPI0032C4620B|nr:hypothetical protein MRS44_003293 [Fusarium solani]